MFGLIKIPIGTIIVREYVAMYIPGDFSEAFIKAQKYEKSGYGPYNPFTHNCLHYAQELLKSGTCRDLAMEVSVSKTSGFIPIAYVNNLRKAHNKAKLFLGMHGFRGGR